MIESLTASVIITGAGQAMVDQIAATPGSGGIPTNMRLCLLVHGAIAADSCACGQFAQSVSKINPSDVFPQDSSLAPLSGPCGPRSLMWTVTASIMRCAPGPDGQGRPPSCQALRTSALTLAVDEYAMRTSVYCYLAGLRKNQRIKSYFVGASLPYGPEGNCAGWDLTYGFQLV